MSGWLLDTNILAELRRPRPEPRVLSFIAEQPLETLHISTVTLAEIRFGIEKLDDPVKRSSLTEWLTHRVRPMFDGRVLPVSEDVMLKWRLLMAEGRKIGHTFPQPDLIIAATGLCHGVAIVTRDIDDYTRTGADLLNPWALP
ncbi:type II toxin-antitoxin system VapC family toxin [Asticcacaulis sp.]|uniref:type II toxin-antitoxin system VapC family toxin n=1 Tax=Asticcacaulis sp. TaxID=1872648 RepID=UPI00261ADED8|nr:type II toxin-antitoxin system VapC family toxin [Asticcacaulis sp.]